MSRSVSAQRPRSGSSFSVYALRFAPSAVLLIATMVLVAGAPAVDAAPAPWQANGQQVDEEYTRRIHENTTGDEFITPLVEFLPASDTVPTPLEHHGYIAGEADHLSYASEVQAYMEALADASPRVMVTSMGTTEEGRDRILVLVSDADTIANIERYKEITARLADPRETTDEEAEALIAEGKALYWAVGGLHSPETGSPEMLMELAYRVAVEERPFFQEIRQGSIVMITPVMEVDGRERVVDINRYRAANPDRPTPPLLYWGKYVSHDNNRDGVGMALTLSRQSVSTFLEYHPQVMHDLHESVPFLYIMSGRGPFNPWLDPIVTEEWTEMAWVEVRQMNEWNVPGVWTHDFWDGWASNYMIYAAMGRNAIGRFYETFGNSSPETRERDIGGQSNRNWFRMNPPYEKVMWSLRNNTNIMQSALLVGMHNVATNKDRFLRSFWTKSKRAVEQARTDGPAAWMIPSDQDRPILTARLVNLLLAHGIEVHRTDEAITVEAEPDPDTEATETEFAAGTYMVRLDQPYSRLADMLLDYQYYNPDDPSPYDDTGWTLGATFNVETYRVEDLAVLEIGMEELGADVLPAGGVRGADAAVWVVNATGEPDLARFRYRLPDVSMSAAEEAFEEGERTFRAGTFIIINDGSEQLRERLNDVGRELGVLIEGLASAPEVPTHPVSAPRIALVHNWNRTQAEGWYRVAFDELGIPYDYISIHDVRDTADLRTRWDVLLFGPGIGGFDQLVNGSPAPHPIPYESSELTPNLGKIASTPDTRPGMGYEGIVNLRRFVEAGGMLATMTSSASFVIDAGLARYARIDNTPPDLQARGAMFKAEIADPASPITYGYQEDPAVYFSSAPLLRVAVGGGGFGGGRGGRGGGARPSGRRGEELVIPGRVPHPDAVPVEEEEEEDVDDEEYTNVDNLLREDDPRVLATRPPVETFPRIVVRFGEQANDLLVSGMLGNGRSLASRPAVIDHPLGDGHIVMFAINPMWRHQTFGQVGMLFNAILHYDALGTGAPTAAQMTEAGS